MNKYSQDNMADGGSREQLFRAQMTVWRDRWRRKRLAHLLFRAFPPVVLAGLAMLAIIDMVLALPSSARSVLLASVILVALVLVARLVVRVLNFGLRDTALWLDQVSGQRRRPLLTVLELLGHGQGERDDGMSAFHLARLTTRANTVLGGVSTAVVRDAVHRRLPQWRSLAAVVAPVLLALLPGGRTSISRVCAPWLDIPPYSKLQFEINPDPVRVVYGDGVEIETRIAGAVPERDVLLRTRDVNGQRATICFQDGESTFSQRLENVTGPVEFCFATGRARSRWRSVELLMRPRILSANLQIVPPSYSGRSTRGFAVGKKPIRALLGARMKLTIASNRALKEGSIQFTDPVNGRETFVAGRADGDCAVFEWTLRQDADLEVEVTGNDGLRCTSPVRVRQTVIPDNPPSTEITELPAFALATPESIIQVGVRAEDDLGVSRVDLIRTVSGFRDRALQMGPDAVSVDHESAVDLDLGQIGVVPGEEIEFFAEGRDTNPALSGISASPVAKLQVISRDDYAAILRRRTTMDEFQARFSVARQTIRDLQQDLNRLREAFREGTWDEAELNEGRLAAAEKAGKAAELFDTLGRDFPIYDLERRFGAEMVSYAGDLKVAAHFLRRFEAGDEKFGETLDFVIDDKVGSGATVVAETAQRAHLASLVGKAMRRAALFNGMVKEQHWLTRVILRATGERVPDLSLLANQAIPQRELAEALNGWQRGLSELAAAMPDELDDIRGDLEGFVLALAELEIVKLMGECADAAEAGRSAEARQKAEEVLSRLLQLRRQCSGNGNCVGQMMCGQMGFKVPGDLEATCKEMLDSLKKGRGKGGGGGGGGGPGNPDDGYSVADEGLRNVPMYGPERTRFRAGADSPGMSSKPGKGGPGGSGADEDIAAPRRETLGEGVSRSGEGAQAAPTRRVHPRYREVIRRYNER